MEPPADDDHCGQHHRHSGDPQTGQKRPADQLDPSSAPNDDGHCRKQLKQETLSEVDLVAYSSPNNHGEEQSHVHDNPDGSHDAAKSIADSTEYPTSSEDRDTTSEHPSKPTEENKPLEEHKPIEESRRIKIKLRKDTQGSNTPLTGVSLASESTSQPQDVHSDNPATLEGKIQASKGGNLELQEIGGGPVNTGKTLQDDYNKLNAKYRKLRVDNAKLQDQCQGLCNQIAVLQSNKPQSTPDEEEIHNLWRMLKFAINNLATQQFHGHPRKGPVMKNRKLFETVTKNFGGYLTNGSKQLFIEAAIWKMLMKEFLYCPSSVYQVAVGSAVRVIDDQHDLGQSEDSRELTLRLTHTWRTLTGQLLHMFYGDGGTYARGGEGEKALSDDMVDQFHRYSSYVDTDPLKQQFIAIIQKAVALAKVMARSEHRYELWPEQTKGVSYGQELEESWMEVESENNSGDGKVELVVSPALIKTEMPVEGEDENPKVLFKARVCW